MATKAAEAEDQEQTPAEPTDGPVLDMSDAAVKKLIKTAKARGFVTYDELNEVLPSEEVTSEQIEDTMSMLSDMGINVIDTDEAEETPQAEEGAESPRAVVAPQPVAKVETAKEPTERTDDPVRMYLREMGSVELLSREGEIAIAKRIEAGREAMIAGLCESPLTFQAIIIWRDELNEGKILLRDIIDLEATYQGPDAKPTPSQPLPGEAAERRRHQWPGRAGRGGCPRRRRGGATRARGIRGRRGRSRERAFARRHGGRAQAESSRDLRPRRHQLQEAPQASGPVGRARAQERLPLFRPGEALQAAQGRDRRRDQIALAQRQPHREPGRDPLRHQQEAARLRGAPAPARRELWRDARGLPRRVSGQRARPQLAPPRRPAEEEGLDRFHPRRARAW